MDVQLKVLYSCSVGALAVKPLSSIGLGNSEEPSLIAIATIRGQTMNLRMRALKSFTVKRVDEHFDPPTALTWFNPDLDNQ